MALEETNGPALGVGFAHAEDSNGGQVQVFSLPATPGSLTFMKGALPGVPFLFAQDTEGRQMPVAALHPDSPGTGGGGGEGTDGDNGWSPILAAIARDNDIVLRVINWTGGSGTKPTVGQYIGAAGLVTSILDAVNIRGLQGASGTGPTKISYSVFVGAVAAATQVVAGFVMPVAVSMNSADFTVHVETAATTPGSVLNILLNGTKVGSVSSTGAVTIDSNPQAIPAGGRVTFKSVTADATWGGITIGASHTKT